MAAKKNAYSGAPTILILLGIVTLLSAIVLGLGGFKMMLKLGIGSQTKIIPGTDAYKMWSDVPLPVFMTIRFFNITNPDEFQQGAKPKLVEVGPYVYREHLYKKEINMFPENDTARYHQYHDYFFERDLSAGPESDVITMINLPYVALAKMAHEFTDADFVLQTLDEMLSKKGETFIRRETVRDILWDGFNVQAYLDLANDPMVEASGQEVSLPPAMQDGRMGLFEGRNGSHEGWFEVNTGLFSPAGFGKFLAVNYETSAKVWNDSSCNSINGTDGMIHPPFLEDKVTMQFFTPQMCRSLLFDFTKEVDHGGIMTRRYQTSQKMFMSPKENPDNWCFCSEKEVYMCNVTGLMSIAPCISGAPMYISNPHLLFADKEIQDMVEGLNPQEELHWGFMDLHPLTAVAIEAKHKFQFNIKITEWPAMPTFENVPNIYLPIFWLQEGADLVGQTLDIHKLLAGLLKGWKFGIIAQGIFGALVLPGLGVLIASRRSKKADQITLISKATPPGERSADSVVVDTKPMF